MVIVLALVAIIIINSVRKSKAMRKRRIDSTATHEFDTFIEKDERIWHEEENNHYPPVHHVSESDVVHPKKKIRKKKSVETAVAFPNDDSGKTSGSEKPADDKEFEFDLRRAVIEAEILNPKFKQY